MTIYYIQFYFYFFFFIRISYRKYFDEKKIKSFLVGRVAKILSQPFMYTSVFFFPPHSEITKISCTRIMSSIKYANF